jgi:outer membrane protein assembly factor BamB
MSKFLVAAVAASVPFFAPTAAFAQSMAPGAELFGQQVRVAAANGDVNTLSFQPDGTVYISSTNGQSAQGNWSVQNNNMCITMGTARECWQYRGPFRAQQALSMVSDCGATTQWTALGVNQPPQQPVQRRAGERG